MAVQIPFRMLDCLENQEEMDVMAHLDLWAHQELVSLAHQPQLCLSNTVIECSLLIVCYIFRKDSHAVINIYLRAIKKMQHYVLAYIYSTVR